MLRQRLQTLVLARQGSKATSDLGQGNDREKAPEFISSRKPTECNLKAGSTFLRSQMRSETEPVPDFSFALEILSCVAKQRPSHVTQRH